MVRESEEAKDQRKREFISLLRAKKCRDLIEPLRAKIEQYYEGKAEADDVFKMAHYISRVGKELHETFKKRPDVILAGIAMEDNKYITEIGEINVKVRQGDLTVVFTDAIVNPASPDGVMAAGISGAIKKTGGEQIEREVRSKAPITPAGAVSTGAGDLPNLHVIHTPTADEPGGVSSPEMITAAMRAALAEAEKIECETLAVPGMGTGVGKVPAGDAAQAILKAIKEHTPTMVNDIILIDRDDEMVDAFIKALEQYDEDIE